MGNIGIGIIGAGAISRSGAKQVQAHEQGTVVAASDPNERRLRELCDEFEIANAYADSAELLANEAVDAVYIAVPNRFHAELAIAAFAAGKHVLLEKPFALNLQEAEAVGEAAKRAGKVFMLGMNQRFRADSQKIRSLIEQGVLGEIYHAKAYWMRRSGIPRLGTWFGSKELAGGGCLLDIGVHLLDLCLYTIGNFDAEAVSGNVYTKFGNRGVGEGGWGLSDRDASMPFDVDDFASAMIRLKGGVTVTLDVSWACHAEEGNRNNVQVYGTDGGAVLYPAKLFRNDPLRTDYDVIENVKAPLAFPHADRFHHFLNVLLGTETLMVTLDQALAVQKILDGIYESAATGREVRLD